MACKHDLIKGATRSPYKEWEFCTKCDYDSRVVSKNGTVSYLVKIEVDLTSEEVAERSSIHEIPVFLNRIAGVLATRVLGYARLPNPPALGEEDD